MIEHRCWRPPLYDEGIAGERVAVCGYSHYSDHRDHDGLTIDIVGDVISGAASYRFFTAIARAFDYDDRAAFWERVLFFNFVPAIIGASEDKFAVASTDENERACGRLWQILEEHQPNKLFVFSEKAWAAFPKTDEEKCGLASAGAEVRAGTYTTSRGHLVLAFASRHPQGASAAALREVVQFGLSSRLA